MEKQDVLNKVKCDQDKLVISFELLQLMDWIIDNEVDILKKIVNKSLKNGLEKQLRQSKNFNNNVTIEQMQNTVIDFLGLLELLFFEVINEIQANNILQKNMMPAIDHIDTTNCDFNVLKSSIDVVTSKLHRSNKGNAQQLFLKELLKRWKPNKNSISN